MSNKVKTVGVSFEVACETARVKSLTPEYRGCAVHVYASVLKDPRSPAGAPREFAVCFGLSDWYSSESTVATYVNGEQRA